MFSISSPDAVTRAATFRNPIAPGADPWVIRHGAYYYWCASERDLGVAVYRSTSLTAQGEKFVVWEAPRRGAYSAQVWAPELHRLDDRWYIYVAASDGDNANHRMIALESTSADPTSPFMFKSELYTGDDHATSEHNRWAIDGTILEHGGKRYFLWSGWEDGQDEQWLYIAPMVNPWTIGASRGRMCANDDFTWERVGERKRGRGLNEGPQVLKHRGRVFVVYSCSGSWEATYKLGLLELLPGFDPLAPAAWQKHAKPVLQSRLHHSCGVGHCSFVKSPDGTEDWIVFHAKVSPVVGWERVIHAQRFTWTAEGRPEFGQVSGNGVELVCPSGDVAAPNATTLAVRTFIEAVRIDQRRGEASGERVTAA